VDKKRDELRAAALKLTTEPLEIVTLPLGRGFGEVGLLVRRFYAPLGICERHPGKHARYIDCKEWQKA
jgi:hypothetical protein